MEDAYFMRQALNEARKALEQDEIPVGAVVVTGNRIIARAHNLTETLHDVTAHAEMQALTAAANTLDSKYLEECTLYVTLEPCVMCAGATYWTQIGRIVFGASDPKRGFQQTGSHILHPKTTVTGGVLEDECGEMLTDFFRGKR
ncbi:MAG: nucleoside deaminase [Bacteroidales bacterium]|nr:nucleoside deaminase [Bacteroidales bacterium]